MISESTKPKTQGYPLGAVFLLIAIVACIIAQFSFREIRNSHPTGEISYAVGLGAFFGLLFGAIVGLYHYRRTHGFFLGCAVGNAGWSSNGTHLLFRNSFALADDDFGGGGRCWGDLLCCDLSLHQLGRPDCEFCQLRQVAARGRQDLG